jgi:hypothetical protein
VTPDGVRVVSSVREVTGTDGEQILTNEVYRPGRDNRGRPVVPLRAETVDRLAAVGFDATTLLQDRW